MTGLNNSIVGDIQVVATPEPSTWAMMALGVSAMGLAMRRNKRKRGKPQDSADFAGIAI